MGIAQALGPAFLSGIFAIVVAFVTSRLTVRNERKKLDRDIQQEREVRRRDFSELYAKSASESKALAEQLSQQFAYAFLYVKNPELMVSDRRFIPPGANIVIGSDPACDITLPNVNGTVSRRHALVQFNGNNFELTDLQSASGTFVNGERVRKNRSLKDGVGICVGDCETHFVLLSRSASDFL